MNKEPVFATEDTHYQIEPLRELANSVGRELEVFQTELEFYENMVLNGWLAQNQDRDFRLLFDVMLPFQSPPSYEPATGEVDFGKNATEINEIWKKCRILSAPDAENDLNYFMTAGLRCASSCLQINRSLNPKIAIYSALSEDDIQSWRENIGVTEVAFFRKLEHEEQLKEFLK